MKKPKRPWWIWVLLAIVGLLIIGAIAGDPDKDSDEQSAQQATTSRGSNQAGGTDTTGVAEPPRTIADAREAVDDDDYTTAVAIATAIGANEAATIRKRIANRLARRSLAALRAGSRGRARTLLIEANDYPMTTQMTQARTSYKAAKARAAQRKRDAVAAKTQRAAEARAREAERDAADQAESDGGSGCASGYSGCVPAYPPDVNCPEVDGPVQVTGDDPHGLDRDGDGVACE